MTQNEIERRLAISWLHPDDMVEVVRIYSAMIESKQRQILDNWQPMIARIKAHRIQMEEERMIVLAHPLKAIGDEYEKYLRSLYSTETEKNLHTLQTNI